MMTMNPALKEFWLTQARYRILVGGRASSKSTDTALHLIRLSRTLKLRILCARQLQNSISQSVYALIKDSIWSLGLQAEYKFTITKILHIATGSEFNFLGISRNIDEIKSMESIDICWLEESHAITQEQWDIINPTIRKEYSEIIITFNPQHRQDFSFNRFVENPLPGSLVKQINYDENPFLSNTISKVIADMKAEDHAEYEFLYLGKPREGDDRALFAYSDIDVAMNNEKVDETGIYTLGTDTARFGNDSSVTSIRRGMRVRDMKEYKGYDVMEMANVIDHIYNSGRIPDAIIIDTLGLGAGTFDRCKQMGMHGVLVEGNVSMKPADPVYYNKRAEMYFKLREFIQRGGKIPNDQALKEELLAMTYFYNQANGKLQIESKDKLKEKLGRSPDKADSVALNFFREVRPRAMRDAMQRQGGKVSHKNMFG